MVHPDWLMMRHHSNEMSLLCRYHKIVLNPSLLQKMSLHQIRVPVTSYWTDRQGFSLLLVSQKIMKITLTAFTLLQLIVSTMCRYVCYAYSKSLRFGIKFNVSMVRDFAKNKWNLSYIHAQIRHNSVVSIVHKLLSAVC